MWKTRLLTSIFILCLLMGTNVSFSQDLIDDQAPQVAAEIPQVIEPLVPYDYVPEYTSEEVKERLKKIESTIELNYNKDVAGFINYFAVRNRNYMRLMIQRKNLYFPLFEKALAKYGLPDELKYLSVVESGLNPKVGSRVGAIGLWQFMPRTGRAYGLKYDIFIDEKMNPEKATEAACKYLSELYGMFHDWQLALASYNCGPGSLRRAIRKSGYKNGFWTVYSKLPKETRAYVPQFIAVTYVMNYAQEHNLNHEYLDYPMASDTILVNKYLDLEVFSSLSKICLEDLQKLNPELKRNAVPEYIKNYPLKIPADKKSYFNVNRYAILDSASRINNSSVLVASNSANDEPGDSNGIKKTSLIRKKTFHTVKRGEVLGSIADKHNVRLSDLRKWNRMRGNIVRRGQRLIVFKYLRIKSVDSETEKKVTIKTSPKKSSQTLENSRFYIVQPGDTLWRITQKYDGLTINQIKKLNNLKDNKIKPGMKLVIG